MNRLSYSISSYRSFALRGWDRNTKAARRGEYDPKTDGSLATTSKGVPFSTLTMLKLMLANTVASPAHYLSLVSSDEDFCFTLDAHLVIGAMGVSSVEMAAISVAYRDELEEDRDFVYVSNDKNEIEKHFTKDGIVKLGELIDTKQSRAFAASCGQFIPTW